MGTDYPVVTLAWTGASGIQYGLRLLECLVKAERQVHLLVSDAARIVAKMEADLSLPSRCPDLDRMLTERFNAAKGQIRSFGKMEWTAPAASGSSAPRAMVVCPCTMGTLAAIAAGMSENLIHRAADVVLKEHGKLILTPRETPFSEIHLENMLRLARMGALILPANPGFYHQPESLQQVIDFIVARVLDHLGVPQTLMPPWGHAEAGE